MKGRLKEHDVFLFSPINFLSLWVQMKLPCWAELSWAVDVLQNMESSNPQISEHSTPLRLINKKQGV